MLRTVFQWGCTTTCGCGTQRGNHVLTFKYRTRCVGLRRAHHTMHRINLHVGIGVAWPSGCPSTHAITVLALPSSTGLHARILQIIIVDGRPQAWYFTSCKERCIKRKKRSNISNTAINEAMVPPRNLRVEATASGSSDDMFAATMPSPSSRPATRGGLVRPASAAASAMAMFATDPGVGAAVAAAQGCSTGSMLGPWPHHGIVARFNGSITLPANGSSASVNAAQSFGVRKKGLYDIKDELVEWFDKPRMLELLPPGQSTLLSCATLHEGVLQRFVEPRGPHNFGLRATWAPNVRSQRGGGAVTPAVCLCLCVCVCARVCAHACVRGEHG
jgi:hypothetical protein